MKKTTKIRLLNDERLQFPTIKINNSKRDNSSTLSTTTNGNEVEIRSKLVETKLEYPISSPSDFFEDLEDENLTNCETIGGGDAGHNNNNNDEKEGPLQPRQSLL